MQITELMLKQIMPHCPKSRRLAVLPYLNAACLKYEIVTELRIAAFLATIAVETAEFRYNEEIASGKAYEGRADLGNVNPGDGPKYKGHGWFQTTGRKNHKRESSDLGEDFITNPKLLTTDKWAALSAGNYVRRNNLNVLADRREFLRYSIGVNGRNRKTGLPNGWGERKTYYERALRVIPDDFRLTAEDGKVLELSETILTDDRHPDFTEGEKPENSSLPETTKVEISDGEVKVETSNNPPVESTTETVTAPPKENSTATATKATVFGIAVPAFVGVAVKSITDLISQGFISAAQIGDFVLNLVKENQKYVLWIVVALIVLLGIKKLCKQITLWLQMYFAGSKDHNNVEVKPQ